MYLQNETDILTIEITEIIEQYYSINQFIN